MSGSPRQISKNTRASRILAASRRQIEQLESRMLLAITLDLTTASDTGISVTDDLTYRNNNSAAAKLAFTVAGTSATGTVNLYADGILVGTAPGASGSTTVLTDGTTALGDGASGFQASWQHSFFVDFTPVLTVTIDATTPGVPAAPDLLSDTGPSNTDNITNDNTPQFIVGGGPYFRFFADGVQISSDYPYYGDGFIAGVQGDGAHMYTVAAVDAAGNLSAQGAGLGVTIDTVAPSVPPAPDLQSSSDSGLSASDNITSDNSPTFDISGATPYFVFYRNGSGSSWQTGSTYTISMQVDGAVVCTVAAADIAGNLSMQSAGLDLVIDTVAPPVLPISPDLQSSSDTGVSDADDLTNDTTPTLLLTGATPYFRVYDAEVLISGAYEVGSSTYTTPVQNSGVHIYRVSAVDAAGNESGAQVIVLEIDTTAPSAPSAPDLQPGSDTGISTTDNITSDTTPTFNVVAAPYFRFYRDNVIISGNYESGSTYTLLTQSGGGTWRAYKVAAVDAAGNVSPLSIGLDVNIDTVAPGLVPEGTHFSQNAQCVIYSFNEPAANVIAANFGLVNLTNPGPVPLSVSYDSPSHVALLTWPSYSGNTGLLTDANYRSWASSSITDIAGNPLPSNALDFFFLNGDANYDRRVDLYDLVAFAINWQGTGKTFSQGDFDYNGVVNSADLGILATHWQQNLAMQAPPLQAALTSGSRIATRTPTRVICLVI